MRSDIVPGGRFPDYELPDHTDTVRKLSELQGDDPLILTLARGHYCPKEHQQHLELAAFYPKIAVAYTQIATISTDDHHTTQEFRASVGAQWPFLSDPERKVQKDLDIQEYTDPDNNPMIPHTLVLKPGLVIHRIYNGYWFWGRPSVADLWRDLREVTSEIRPDWDLSAPGLREAWDAGDLSRFHGWNKPGAAKKVRPDGTLLFIGGTGGRRTAPGMTLVSALTAAMPALTKSLALEIAPVRVNLIAAGFVDTPLSAALLGDQLEARREQLRTTLPIRRVVAPQDIAALAVHLMTNTAVTGATYDIDGGQQLVA